jgi:hypothetical protein
MGACFSAPRLAGRSSSCSQDWQACFIDDVLQVLICSTKQIAFDDDRTFACDFRAALSQVDTAERLLAGVRLGLRTGPAIEPGAL